MAIDVGDIPLTWRENSREGLDRNRRGAPFCIEQGQLIGLRDHLVWLLDNSWGELGWALQRVRTANDVPKALASWQQLEDSNYAVKCLLRPTEIRITAKRLNSMRRERRELNELAFDAFKRKEACRESLERIQRASRPELSAGELLTIESELTERARALEEAEQELAAMENSRLTLETRLQDGETYFARQELADFCSSGRYEITPLSTANAVAGLPFIGWRQSMKRCKPEVCPLIPSLNYEIFKILRRMVNACAHRESLVSHTERWLRNKKPSQPSAIFQMRKNWYYLRRAIQATLQEKRVLSRRLPFQILATYQQRMRQPSAADYALEESERISE